MISIIVSVYNVGPYIKDCIQSVLKLDLPMEVIIVHDEAKDNSFRGDEDYIQDKRISILNRTNAGLGAARNDGLEVAKGDYIFFLDGDDMILADNFKLLYENGKKEKSDMIAGDYDDHENPIKCQSPSLCPIHISGKDFLLNCAGKMNFTVWRYIYKKNFLINHHLTFEKVKFAEDMIFTPIALYRANTVYYDNLPFYYYRYVPGSLVNSYSIKRLLDIFTAFDIIYDECSTMPEKDIAYALRTRMNGPMMSNINLALESHILSKEYENITRSHIKAIISDKLQLLIFKWANIISWRFFKWLNVLTYDTVRSVRKILR